MPEPILCKICGQRRAKRACPAVEGDICSICCGTEREVSLACPLECEYLREGHRHEKAIETKDLADPDIEVKEEFLREHEDLLMFCMYALVEAAARTPGAVDTDVLAALEALIKTRRTSESGLVYETRAENGIGAGVQRLFVESLTSYEKTLAERENFFHLKDSDLLKVLVFLRRIGQQNLNGRPRGRMYIDVLRHMIPASAGVDERSPSIIL